LKKRTVLGIVIGLSIGYMFASLLHVQSFGAEHATIVVPDDFPTIQEAINKARSGDTIHIKASTFRENVFVNKSISLIGENRYNTVIDGSELGTVIKVTASNVSIANLTVRNAGSLIGDSGIELSGVDNCSIDGNVLIENGNIGIMLHQSIGNAVIANIVKETGRSGIIVYSSNNNTVSGNTVQNASEYGIVLQNSSYCDVTGNIVTCCYEGIVLVASNRNSVCLNTVTESASHGIRLDDPSDYNTFAENTLANNNGYGFWMWFSSYNLFYHNLCNNSKNVLVLSAPAYGYNSTNAWDNGYPSGGNYWSDYEGQDLCTGPYQNETGSDGIGDTPYVIDEYNKDLYPLMTLVVIEYPSTMTLLSALVFATFLIVAGKKKLEKHDH
jgi:parallel beta-helix repeat protein